MSDYSKRNSIPILVENVTEVGYEIFRGNVLVAGRVSFSGASLIDVGEVPPSGAYVVRLPNYYFQFPPITSQPGDLIIFTTSDDLTYQFHDEVDESISLKIESIYSKTLGLGSATVNVNSPITAGGTVSLIAGDDYYSSERTVPDWSGTTWPDLTGATVVMKVYNSTNNVIATYPCIVTASGGETQAFKLELSSAETTALFAIKGKANYRYDIEFTLAGGHKLTQVRGTVNIGVN